MYNLKTAISKTKARIFRSMGIFIFLLPKYPPSIPPTKTTAIKDTEDPGKVPPFDTNPKSPEIEFTKINNAETAAVCFIFAQPRSKITGLKIMPPPIPINPDKKPIRAPINKANERFIGFKSPFCFPNNPTNLAIANNRTVARIIL